MERTKRTELPIRPELFKSPWLETTGGFLYLPSAMGKALKAVTVSTFAAACHFLRTLPFLK